jgi:hypothetical protein
LTLGGLAVVVVLSIGVVVGLLLGGGGGPGNGQPVRVTLAATAADPATGASMSVVVISHGNAVTVRATIAGLRAGVRYQLYAVTSDGQTSVVRVWIGAEGAQDVSGDLSVRADRLAFFSVTTTDGAPVVSAFLNPRPYRTSTR